jgi:hypothetical protein
MCLVMRESLIFLSVEVFLTSLSRRLRVLRLLAIFDHLSNIVVGIDRSWKRTPKTRGRLRQVESVEGEVVENVVQPEVVHQTNLGRIRSHLDQVLCSVWKTGWIVDNEGEAISQDDAVGQTVWIPVGPEEVVGQLLGTVGREKEGTPFRVDPALALLVEVYHTAPEFFGKKRLFLF